MRFPTTRLPFNRFLGNNVKKWRCFTGLLLVGLLYSSSAGACQICVPVPERTLADRLLEAEGVVLAREDPGRPYSLVAVEVVKGGTRDLTIDAFLNSQARRTLAAHPERAMVLVRVRGSEDWRTLGIADAEVAEVVRLIVENSGKWSPLETDNIQRLHEFAPLLGHENGTLHELAYLEIGRAPYGTIREIASKVSVDTVRSMLEDPHYMEWRSLAILMLAQTRAPADDALIRKRFADKQAFGSTLNLTAWTTAYIAVDGAKAISSIERLYLSRRSRSPEELSAVLEALSIQAGDNPQWQKQIVATYRTLLEVHPEMADEIADDLIAWRRWDFLEQVSLARAQRKDDDPPGTHALDLYLKMAGANLARAAEAQSTRELSSRPASTRN
jgi:hypothetical protein